VNHTRRQWIIQGSTLALGTSISFSYQTNPVTPLEDGPETERFRNAQRRALAKYKVEAQSRFFPARLVVEAGPVYAQQFTLAADAEIGMHQLHERAPILSRAGQLFF
jgi:hypothetical protein